MGGKSKQSQRTKNNARPSSSSRSAELLGSSTSVDGGLLTLGNGKPLPPLFPTLAASNLEQGLNPEFQMCIKKLNKKDPITRAKALQELCELINNGDVEDVVSALPSWAHFYKILTADTDRKVREMTQACQGAAARAAGRRLAPQLRALLPAWLAAQHDEHAPARALAHHALTSTFPDSKLPEVISFCKAEVIAYLLDNLNGNTEALVKKRIENAEERELQMNRTITSSLQGLQYFTRHLPGAHDAWLWAELAPLLQGNAFWKFAHGTPQVRAAWLGAVGGLAARYKGTFGPHAGRTLRLLLGGAADARVAEPLWSCLLLLMQNVPDWHTYLDKKELLIKRILEVLENGGWGDARHMSNVLLPLLGYLPQDILTEDFYEAFFNAVFVGLEKKNVLNSKSERQAWITSLAECLRYLSIQPNDFVVPVVTNVHRTWLERALSMCHDEQTRTHLIKSSATDMTGLVKYWLKQSKDGKTEKYDQLVGIFWQNVDSTILTQIDESSTDHNEIGKLIDGHILFLQTLKSTFSQEAKKQLSVKFDGDERTAPPQCDAAPPQCDAAPPQCDAAPPQCDAAPPQCEAAERFSRELQRVLQGVAARCVRRADTAPALLARLAALLRRFRGVELLAGCAGSAHALYFAQLRRWLADDALRCKDLVDVVFLSMDYMSEDEQDAVFDSFQQLPAPVAEWALGACADGAGGAAGPARRWLRGGCVAALLAQLAGRGAGGDAGAAELLLACLAVAPSGARLVSAEAAAGALRAAGDALHAAQQAPERPDEQQPEPADEPDAEQAEEQEAEQAEEADEQADEPEGEQAGALAAAAALAARLVEALAGEAGPQYERLLLQLLRLDVRMPRRHGAAAWRAGAAALGPGARAGLRGRAAALLRDLLLHSMDDFNITKIENIVSPCPHLFNRCDDTGAPDDVTEIVAFTKLIFDIEEPETHTVESYALRYECVTSQLNCLYDDDNDVIATVIGDSAKCDVKELTEKDLLSYVNKTLFRAMYLRRLLFLETDGEDSEDEPSGRATLCDVLLQNEYLQEEFCKVVYNYIVIDSLHEGYAFWRRHGVLARARRALGAQLAPPPPRAARALAARAPRAYLWPRCLRWCQLQAPQPPPAPPAPPAPEEDLSGNAFFHTLQASTKWSADSQAEERVQYLAVLRGWCVALGGAPGDVTPPGDVTRAGSLAARLARDVTRARDCDMDVLVDAYYEHNDLMLYDRDIAECPWSAVVSSAAAAEFLRGAVTSRGWQAEARHWDFVCIALSSLLSSVRRSLRAWDCTKVAMLTRAVLRLWVRVREFVRDVPAASQRRQPSPHVAALPREWRDIFAPDTHYSILALALHVLDSCTEGEMTSNRIEVIGALIECIKLSEWSGLRPAGELSLARLQRSAAAALQRAPHHACAYLAHAVLLALAEPLVLEDAEKLALWSEDSTVETEEEKERPQFCLDLLHDAFMHLHEMVEAELGTVVLGEGRRAPAGGSRAHGVLLSWLLLGAALGAQAGAARGELAQQFVRLHRERRLAALQLGAALRLLPARVWAACCGAAPAAPPGADLFLRAPQLSVYEAARGADVGALACRGVYGAVCGAGAGDARGWWGALPARPARLLSRLVRLYVAPHAVREQLLDLQRRAAEIEDAEIRIAWSSNEVTCVYNVEERYIELRVWLSREHPLVPPRLAAPDAQGPGANTHWVALYLAYQNGTLLNALKMWTAAVSARVESSPQCYICYCRLHPTSGRLPRVPCHQCRNKFHNVCLRKWFATSNKSSCPLCRSAF